MAIRQIRVIGDEILTKACKPVKEMNERTEELIEDMFETMYENNGCGLAAPQVGITKRLVVIDCDPESTGDYIALVNPVITETRGEEVTEEEGCLSCPGISVPIRRKEWARCEYFDLDGNPCVLEGDGLLGRCMQHECDHLDGHIYIDRLDRATRKKALRDIRNAGF